MKKLFLTYLLLLNFCYLFFSGLWGGHLHHTNLFSFYSFTNFEQKTTTEKNDVCLKYSISESILEHLFENGVIIENTKTDYFSKFSNDFFTYFKLPVENYNKGYKVQKSNIITGINIPKMILLFKVISPRPPPFFS